MPLPSSDQTNPESPTSSSSRSLLSPTENVANVEVDNVQHQDGASAAAAAQPPSYSSMAAKTVANIKRLQVRSNILLSLVWR